MHLLTCSPHTPSKTLLYHIRDVTLAQTVGRSYPRVEHSILFVRRLPPVHKVRPYHRSTFAYTIFAMFHVDGTSTAGYSHSSIEPNRLPQIPYTDLFLTHEQASIVSKTVDDPYHINVQASTRHLGNIATLPTSCDTSARRQLLVFPSSTACIVTDSKVQLIQDDTVLVTLKPKTRGILLVLALTAAASTRP